MTYIKYIEISVGLGLGIGPLAGDALYESTDNFALSMYIFAGLNLFTLLLCVWLIPGELNITASENEIDEIQNKVQTLEDIEAQSKKKKIGWGLMFTNRHSFFAIMIALIGTFDIMFFKGFLAEELKGDEEDLADGGINFAHYTGYIMAIPAFVYLVACLLLPYTCEHTSRKFLFFFSMMGFAGCIFLLGPSEILGFPDNVWLILASQPPMGIF